MDKRIQRTKKTIKQAMMELAKKKSYDQISVTEVADKAGVARKTFYIHYDCLRAVMDEIANDVGEALKNGADRFLSTEVQDVAAIFGELNAIVGSDGDFWHRIASDISYDFFRSEIRDMLSILIAAIMEESFLKEDPSAPQYATFYSYAISGLFFDWLANPKGLSFEQISASAIKCVSHSLRSLLKKQPY